MMSEPETKIEIEDVLSSIRRLVSRDAGAVRTMPVAMSATPRAAVPVAAPVPAPQPVEAECLVLTPALRIEDAEEEVALMAPPMPEPEVAPFVAFEAPELVEAAEAVAEAEIVAFELQDLADPAADDFEAFTEDLPGEAEAAEDAGPLLLSEAEPTFAPDVFDETAPLLLQPSEVVAPAEILPFVPPAPPRVMTEAEILLAEAEAALMETGAVLDDASNAIDAAGETEEPTEVESEAPRASIDLGDELSRLESTIAELEAAVAESGFEFEPETGHPFEVSATETADELPEAFEAEVREALEAPLTDDLPMPESVAVAQETTAELIDEVPLAPVAEVAASASAEAWAEDAAEDAAEALDTSAEAWAEEEDMSLAQQEFAATAQAEMIDPEEGAQPVAEDSGVGMDWAEATLNLARRTPPRRLAVSDAEETVQTAATMRSSYEELRDELSDDMTAPETLYSEDLVPSYEDGLIDEAVLRDMVAQLVREELRGSLGERITQNVRKLVRREIQRALTGQDFE